VPALIGPLNVELNESAGQLLILPRGGRFACSKPNDRIVDADRLPRLQLEVANDPIALVEKAQNGHPLGHGSDARALPKP
jgi:hypothetical protein